MKKNIIFLVFMIGFCLQSCKINHPYFSQIDYTDKGVNVVTHLGARNSKDFERMRVEIYELMVSKCPNYIILKTYSTNSGSGTIVNSNGNYSKYVSNTYYHYEFKCAKKDTIIERKDISMLYNNVGWKKYKQGIWDKSLMYLNKAIETDKTNLVAWDSRQELKFKTKDYQGCLADCNMALSLNSNLANSYLFRGKYYYIYGDKDKAREDWNKAGILGKKEGYKLIKQYLN